MIVAFSVTPLGVGIATASTAREGDVMGFMDNLKAKLGPAKGKVSDLAQQHGGKIDQGLDKAARAVDQRTKASTATRSRRVAARPRTPSDPEHFFDLESIEDPHHLLDRATELTHAFRAATDRSMEFQALAAAQLADPRRFDRLTPGSIADRAGWTEDYARKMIEFGRRLQRGGEGGLGDQAHG